jgi:hypothetical protein
MFTIHLHGCIYSYTQGLLLCFKHYDSHGIIGDDEFHRENDLYLIGKKANAVPSPRGATWDVWLTSDFPVTREAVIKRIVIRVQPEQKFSKN